MESSLFDSQFGSCAFNIFRTFRTPGLRALSSEIGKLESPSIFDPQPNTFQAFVGKLRAPIRIVGLSDLPVSTFRSESHVYSATGPQKVKLGLGGPTHWILKE